MVKYKIYNINGEFKCDVKALEYSGKWMGECYVSVDVVSPIPIQFELGDYIDYRGTRYSLNSAPSSKKSHSALSSYNAFSYEGVKFMGPNDELMRCSFLDYVFDTKDETGSNVNYFAQTPIFSFNCETIYDLTDRIQVNLNRLYNNWEIRVNETSKYAHNVDISVDKNTVWDALLLVNTHFKSSFVVKQELVNGVRKNVILIGDTMEINKEVLGYGKGKGFTEIQRSREDNHSVVNRLRVYGSTQNLPYKYYSEVYDPWYKFPYTTNGDASNISWHKNQEKGTGVYPITTKLDFIVTSPIKKQSVNVVFSDDITKVYNGYLGTREAVEGDGLILDDKVVGSSWQYYLVVRFYPIADVTEESKTESLRRFSDVDKILITSGITRLMASTMVEKYWVSPYQLAPEFVSVDNLMLPNFLDYFGERNGVVYELDKTKTSRIYDDKGNIVKLVNGGVEYTPIYIYDSEGKHVLDEDGYWKIKLQSDPYIEDKESIAKYGIREGCVFFDSEEEYSETPAIYPSIQGDKKNYIAIGTKGEIEDNGFLEDEDKLKGGILEFYLYVPYLGFDPKNYWSEKNPTLKMNSGPCMGRSFELVGDNNHPIRESVDGTVYTKFRLKRVYDEQIKCYFPNKDTEIAIGDEFILLDIDLPRKYVEDASKRLLEAAQEYLEEYSEAKFTATPTFDNIQLARDYDSNGENSVYYNLKEGYLLKFKDEDLGFDVSEKTTKLYIDNLTIKEAEGKVPVVETRLVREKEFSTIQRLQSEIHQLKNARKGDFSLDNVRDLINSANSDIQLGGENLLRNTGFNGDYISVDLKDSQIITSGDSLYGNRLEHWKVSNINDVISVENQQSSSGYACNMVSVGSWIQQEVKLIPKENYTLSFMCRGEVETAGMHCGAEGEEKLCKINIVGSENDSISFVALSENTSIWDVKIERGNIRTDWTPSHKDTDPVADELTRLQYLQDALKGKTEILGGLILSSMIQLGNYRDGQMEQVTAGISGITSTPEIDVAFWGGGTFEQAIKAVNMFRNNPSYQPTEEEVASIAKAVITHGGRAILNDIVLRGYIYALGGVFNGTVYAKDGIFKGRVEAKEGYFLGSTRSIMTEITHENVSQYAISGNGTVDNPYNFDFDKTGVCVRFKGNLGNVYFGLPYMTPTTPVSSLERDKFRTRDFSKVLMYNNTTADTHVGVSLRTELSSVNIPRGGWVEFCGKIIYDYNNDKGFGVGERLSWSYIIYDPSGDGPMEASLD